MKFLATLISLFFVWILVTGFVVEELITGLGVSLALSAILVKYTNYAAELNSPIKLIKFIFVYIPVFVWQLLLSNLDIAKRVLTPRIPLNPGIVKVKTDLEGDIGKLTLANSITLTPGTLTLDIVDGDLYVHCVDIEGSKEEGSKKDVSGPFEKLLKGIFK